MKNLLIAVFTASIVLLQSCSEKGNWTPDKPDNAQVGKVELNIQQEGTFSVKSEDLVDVKDFRVRIWKGETLHKEYAKYSSVPNVIELEPGSYKLEAGTTGEKEAAFSQPIYSGSSDFTVQAGKVSSVNVKCALTNMKITINCSDKFFNELNDDFKIVVKNENNAFLIFTKEIIKAGTSGYFKVSKLSVIVQGTRKTDGSEINHVIELNDGAAKDHHVLNFDVQETGYVDFSKDGITVDYTVNEKEATIVIPGEDETPIEDEDDNNNPDPQDPQPGDQGQGEQPNEYLPTITGNGINATLKFTNEQATSAVIDVVVTALNGKTIQHLDVKIESAFLTEDFMSETDFGGTEFSLTDFGDDQASIDRKQALAGIKLINPDDPIAGKTSYSFSIGGFVPMLFLGAEVNADNKFTITVEDSDGKKAQATINIVKVE